MNIIQIEKERNWIAELLTSSASPVYRLQILISFLKKYKERAGMNTMQSFFLEFSSPLFQLISEYTLKYADPLYQNSVLDILNLFPEHFSQKFSPQKLTTCQNLVREQLIQTWIIAGEWEKTFPLLETITGESVGSAQRKQIRNELSGVTDPFEHIQGICLVLQEHHPKSARILEKIADTWDQDFRQPHSDRMHLLLTEKNGLKGYANEHALLLPIHLNVRIRPRDAEEDMIKFNNDLIASQGPVYNSIADCITSVRLYAAHNLPASVTRSNFSFQFSVPEKNALYTGDSWGASLALLTFCGLVNTYYKQKIATLQGSTVVTGALDSRGQLKPVTHDTLPAKIKTAFFSPLRRLIVPMHNMTAALDCLQKLHQEYPHRHLQLESAENLNQLLNDQNLIKQKKITLFHKSIYNIRQICKKPAFYLASILLMLFLVFSFMEPLQWWRNRIPAAVEVIDTYLIVKNNESEKLWEYDFKKQLSRKWYEKWRTNYTISDLDGDGRKEILWGLFEPDHPELSGWLYVFNHKGNILWKKRTGGEMTFAGIKFENHYRVYSVKTEDMDGDGLQEVITVSYHWPDFPCCIQLFSSSGDSLGEYRHSGQFANLKFYDQDGDGIKEIFALGQNNEYGGGVLAVLDFSRVKGCSPQSRNGKYYAEGPHGFEKYYLRFPPSEFVRLNSRDGAYDIKKLTDHYSVAVGNAIDYTRKVHENNIYYAVLNENFTLQRIIISDYYKIKFKEIFNRDLAHTARLQLKNILYWDGTAWQDKPIMTRYWREQSNHQ